MAKYKIKIEGFAYVFAADEAQAEEKFNDEDYVYWEHEIFSIEEVDEFLVEV